MKSSPSILSYPLTVLFYLFFGINMLLFHPIQWICFNVFGYQAHKKSVDYFNFIILRCLNILGTRFQVINNSGLDPNIPVIFVSNHQSMWDIPPIIWFLRRYHPKFISKAELGKGIPSISYNLRHGGSILIDRKNPRQALSEMIKFAGYLLKHKRAGIIFPEGTRSRNGEPKPFYRTGLNTLFKKMPEAYVVPVTINNSWKLQQYGMFPMPVGVPLKMQAHPALKISDFEVEELIDKVETTIKAHVHP